MEKTEYDFIIIGGGAAGLAAAQYGARANLSTLVLDSGMYGGQAVQIFSLENYPGIYPAVKGTGFTDLMRKQAAAFGAETDTARVSSIDKTGGKFVLETTHGKIQGTAVLLATGASHRKLNVPGEETFFGRGVSYCATCDGPFFKDKRIAVIGGGDSACDEATYLASLSSEVTVIHRRGSFRAQKAVAERVMNNPSIQIRFNTVVQEIRGNVKVEALLLKQVLTGETEILPVDGVFIFAGIEPQSQLAEILQKDENGYIITNDRMETAVEGLFCAGDLRSKPFRQLITAASDGAIAAHCAGEYINRLRNKVYN